MPSRYVGKSIIINFFFYLRTRSVIDGRVRSEHRIRITRVPGKGGGKTNATARKSPSPGLCVSRLDVPERKYYNNKRRPTNRQGHGARRNTTLRRSGNNSYANCFPDTVCVPPPGGIDRLSKTIISSGYLRHSRGFFSSLYFRYYFFPLPRNPKNPPRRRTRTQQFTITTTVVRVSAACLACKQYKPNCGSGQKLYTCISTKLSYNSHV